MHNEISRIFLGKSGVVRRNPVLISIFTWGGEPCQWRDSETERWAPVYIWIGETLISKLPLCNLDLFISVAVFEEREMEERVAAIIWGILKWRLIEIISELTLADAIQFDLGLNLRLDSEIEHLPAPCISVLSFSGLRELLSGGGQPCCCPTWWNIWGFKEPLPDLTVKSELIVLFKQHVKMTIYPCLACMLFPAKRVIDLHSSFAFHFT